MERGGEDGSRMHEPSSQLGSSMRRDGSTYSHVVKPLLNGFLTGQLHALSIYGVRLIILLSHKGFPDYNTLCKAFPRSCFVFGGAYTTASLGIFEILTKKLRNGNEGMPLTLYQEACSGLTSSATAGFVWQPFLLARKRVGLQNLTCRNWFSTLFHIIRNEGAFALWRGSAVYMVPAALSNMGMLVSYNRSLNYLKESKSISNDSAQFSASIISAFFAAASGRPYLYTVAIKDAVKKANLAGEKNPYRSVLSRILTRGCGYDSYSNFMVDFRRCAWIYVVQWAIYEEIRKRDAGN